MAPADQALIRPTRGGSAQTGRGILEDMGASYTSELAATLAPDILERFQRYVRMDTQSHRERDRSPSTPGQMELAQLLCAELREFGLADAEVDENGYVMTTLPASGGSDGHE